MPVIRKQCYTIPILSRGADYADGQTVYIGFRSETGSASLNDAKLFFAKAGIITQVILIADSEGGNGTNEAWTVSLRLNDTTNTTLAVVSAAVQLRDFSNRSLSIPVTTSDFVTIYFITPTWATNPVTTTFRGYIIVSY